MRHPRNQAGEYVYAQCPNCGGGLHASTADNQIGFGFCTKSTGECADGNLYRMPDAVVDDVLRVVQSGNQQKERA